MAKNLTIGALVLSLVLCAYLIPSFADPVAGTPAGANMMAAPGHPVMMGTPAGPNFMSTPGHNVVMGPMSQPTTTTMPHGVQGVDGMDMLDYLY
jgi:hypothetical protein